MKKFIIPALILVVLIAWYGLNQYNRKPADLATSKADIALAAADLANAYATNETTADKEYLNKIIAVKGKITSTKQDGTGKYVVQLEGNTDIGISCQIDDRHIEPVKNLASGVEVTLKGSCAGVLDDVVLTRCVLDK